IEFLKLLDVEQYELDVEIILKHILSKELSLKIDSPPYNKIEHITNEYLLYWRVLCDYYYKVKNNLDIIDELMPDAVEFEKLFENNLSNNFICKQLLQ